MEGDSHALVLLYCTRYCTSTQIKGYSWYFRFFLIVTTPIKGPNPTMWYYRKELQIQQPSYFSVQQLHCYPKMLVRGMFFHYKHQSCCRWKLYKCTINLACSICYYRANLFYVNFSKFTCDLFFKASSWAECSRREVAKHC